MLDSIRKFVQGNLPLPSRGAAGGGKFAPVQVAACALLLELAHADGEFSDSERAHIEGAMARHFDLDDSTIRELMDLAATERMESVDHFQFTRVIGQQFDLSQKLVLAEVMWGVILADGKLAEHETYLVRKLGNLLDLKPGYLAQARRSAAGDQPD
jgi:uncharacterized tellurite resistance protein B-like protein